MLVYHPCFDANHCAYRFLHLLYSSKADSFEWDILRIADFYYVFPHLIKHIKPMPKSLTGGKKYFSEINPPYESIPNPKRLLFDLQDIQNSTIASLVSKQIIKKEMFNYGVVSLNADNIPKSLIESFHGNPINNSEWFKFFSKGIAAVDLNGKNGFKSRTGLLEYRYDQ
ncbi:ABC-three component system middle component 5 [Thiothrix subterranea]|uniref:Uncharacterized protein n=1 Tax=Thiothrix subterranea TaxID=2735563 RepID=A0AA51MPY9_9GAMM|nr:ABC-three component system middle component 5 [Thiothrix subterranea]MDQ5766981.1 hypothetical protein [Thiothrix subterranea]WML88158.1 hypothetical protein RCG00_07220 [Thiothrix subterranea]